MNAVKRTKLKRKFRAALYPILQNKEGFSVALVGYQRALTKTTTELKILIEEKLTSFNK